MAEYYSVIARAVSALSINTTEAREILYQRAREALIASLTSQNPSIPDADVDRERIALEESIRRVEDEALGQTSKTQAVNAAPSNSTNGNVVTNTTALAQEEAISPLSRDTHQTATSIDTAVRLKSRRLLMTFRKLDLVLFCFSFSLSISLATLVFATGISWFSKQAFNYSTIAVSAALIFCALDLLPRRRSKGSNAISLYLLLISSYVFALATWLLGVLITFHHWGRLGLALGLSLGMIGVVPLAIVASGLHSDWTMMVVTLLGVLVSYGARDLAYERTMEQRSPRPRLIQP
jgi:hypothetical protein